MGYGAKFVLDADDRASKKIENVSNAFDGLTNTVKGELTAKLKAVFSAVAIEEAARRTGEWAQKIDQTSKSLGISAEMLQTLQLLASKTNTPEDAVVGMFENIAKARQDAINGNKEMINSFTRLGVSIEDVFNKNISTQDFVSNTISAIPRITAEGSKDRKAGDITGPQREAMEAITGTSAGTMAGIQKGLAGTDLSASSDENVKEGNVVDNQSIADLKETLSEVMTTFKEAGVSLIPVGKILLGIAKIIANAVAAIGDIFSGLWDTVGGLLSGNLDKASAGIQKVGQILINGIFGIVKIITGVMDLLPDIIRNTLGKIPVIGKQVIKLFPESNVLTGLVEKAQASTNAYMGTTEKIKTHGEALGTAVGTVLTIGVGNIGKIGKFAAGEAGGVASKVGLGKTGAKLSEMGAGGSAEEIATAELATGEKLDAVSKRVSGTVKEGMGNYVAAGEKEMKSKGLSRSKMTYQTNNGITRPYLNKTDINGNVTELNEAESEAEYNNIKTKRRPILKDVHEQLKKMPLPEKLGRSEGLGRIVASGKATVKGTDTGTPNEKFGPIIGQKAMRMQGTSGGNTSGLALGGVFGSNYQSRLVLLNQKMVDLLTQIRTNTGTVAGQQAGQPSGFPPTGYGGGQ